jgi:hypothetical protein
MPDTSVLFERLGVALAIGLLIGLERGWKTRELDEGHRLAGAIGAPHMALHMLWPLLLAMVAAGVGAYVAVALPVT